MSETTVPKPLAAYVGLLFAAFEDAGGPGRSTTAQVIRLPLTTASQLLTARRRYDALAEQGSGIVEIIFSVVRQRLGARREEAGEWIGDPFGRGRSNGTASKFERVADELETVIDEELETVLDEELADAKVQALAVKVGAVSGLKAADDLPLADFDQMTGPQLRGRLRTLNRAQLVQLLDYERGHTNRVGIVLMLENRLTKLDASG